MRRWTLEERARQAELIQEWQPWKQSTGAKTAEGRGVSRMNSLKHGSYSAEAKAELETIKSYLKETVIF